MIMIDPEAPGIHPETTYQKLPLDFQPASRHPLSSSLQSPVNKSTTDHTVHLVICAACQTVGWGI
jgi:hypothetical protein